jgi:hypothetical protein
MSIVYGAIGPNPGRYCLPEIEFYKHQKKILIMKTLIIVL